MELRFQVQTKIARPVGDVFDAVYNPKKLTGYFATGGSTGPLDEGATVTWKWHDHPDISEDVTVTQVIENELIQLEWQASEGGYNTVVMMQCERLDARTTMVKISESGWRETPRSLENSYGNCEGWTEMLCCLKAFVEHGINLRENYY